MLRRDLQEEQHLEANTKRIMTLWNAFVAHPPNSVTGDFLVPAVCERFAKHHAGELNSTQQLYRYFGFPFCAGGRVAIYMFFDAP